MRWTADKLFFRDEDDFVRAYKGDEMIWDIIPDGYTRVLRIYTNAGTINECPYIQIPDIPYNFSSLEMVTDIFFLNNDNVLLFDFRSTNDIVDLSLWTYYNSDYGMSNVNFGIPTGSYSGFTYSQSSQKTVKLVHYTTSNREYIYVDGVRKLTASQSFGSSSLVMTLLRSDPYYATNMLSHQNGIYSLVIKDVNSKKIHKCFPVVNDTTGKAGLWDVETRTFYGNIGGSGTVDILYDPLP